MHLFPRYRIRFFRRKKNNRYRIVSRNTRTSVYPSVCMSFKMLTHFSFLKIVILSQSNVLKPRLDKHFMEVYSWFNPRMIFLLWLKQNYFSWERNFSKAVQLGSLCWTQESPPLDPDLGQSMWWSEAFLPFTSRNSPATCHSPSYRPSPGGCAGELH